MARILSLPLSLTLPLSEGYLTINTSSLKSDCVGPNELEMEALLVFIRSPRGFQLNSNPDCLLSHTPVKYKALGDLTPWCEAYKQWESKDRNVFSPDAHEN